jgi:hypothetical protein
LVEEQQREVGDVEGEQEASWLMGGEERRGDEESFGWVREGEKRREYMAAICCLETCK